MKKFEKITLITSVETRKPNGTTSTAGITALDHIIPTLEKYLSADITLIDYEESEYELVEKNWYDSVKRLDF